MKILAWNVNGIRSVSKKGFAEWLAAESPDILCLQEVKANFDQIPQDVREPKGYKTYFHAGIRKGYSGTAIYTKEEPKFVTNGLGIEEFDNEGRVLSADYGDFVLITAYFPNSQPERARLDYKLRFCAAMQSHLDELVKQGRHVILCGDYNVAHKPIDLARPDENEDSPGYYIEERNWMDGFIAAGYVDTFRRACQEPDRYSWWSYRTRARERNVGWRIDYHCVNPGFADKVKDAYILPEVHGSDHCPVGIVI